MFSVLAPARFTHYQEFMRALFFIIAFLFATSAPAAEDSCELQLTQTRYRDDFRELKKRGVFWDVNPNFYQDVHGGTRIYHQAFERIEKPLRSVFNHVQDGFSEAVTRYLLLSSSVQARVRGQDGKPAVTHIWLNGRPWGTVLEQIEGLEASEALRALGEMATDRTRLGLPPMERDSIELEEAAVAGEELNVFTLSGREAQTIQLKVRRRIAEELERFMDYRTSQDILTQMARDGLIFVRLEIVRDGIRDGIIRIVDAHGFKRPMNLVIEDLRKWYANQNALRARAARHPGQHSERTPERLVSRIYERPDSTPMDRRFWKKFGSE